MSDSEKNILNLTPHDVVVLGDDGRVVRRFPKSGIVARCSTFMQLDFDHLGDVPVCAAPAFNGVLLTADSPKDQAELSLPPCDGVIVSMSVGNFVMHDWMVGNARLSARCTAPTRDRVVLFATRPAGSSAPNGWSCTRTSRNNTAMRDACSVAHVRAMEVHMMAHRFHLTPVPIPRALVTRRLRLAPNWQRGSFRRSCVVIRPVNNPKLHVTIFRNGQCTMTGCAHDEQAQEVANEITALMSRGNRRFRSDSVQCVNMVCRVRVPPVNLDAVHRESFCRSQFARNAHFLRLRPDGDGSALVFSNGSIVLVGVRSIRQAQALARRATEECDRAR